MTTKIRKTDPEIGDEVHIYNKNGTPNDWNKDGHRHYIKKVLKAKTYISNYPIPVRKNLLKWDTFHKCWNLIENIPFYRGDFVKSSKTKLIWLHEEKSVGYSVFLEDKELVIVTDDFYRDCTGIYTVRKRISDPIVVKMVLMLAADRNKIQEDFYNSLPCDE